MSCCQLEMEVPGQLGDVQRERSVGQRETLVRTAAVHCASVQDVPRGDDRLPAQPVVRHTHDLRDVQVFQHR